VAKRILVVDDNDDVRVSTALLLRAIGHEVHDARDGRECLGIAKTVPLDVVLLDIGMPGMNGYEVARQLRQRPELATLTLIAMTGYNPDYNRQKWHKVGFDHYLIKPLDQSKLDKILAGLAET
jgi:two-component system CheB/CheR fusion protein